MQCPKLLIQTDMNERYDYKLQHKSLQELNLTVSQSCKATICLPYCSLYQSHLENTTTTFGRVVGIDNASMLILYFSCHSITIIQNSPI